MLYTDGITEARDAAGVQFDEAGVARVLGTPADGVLDAEGIVDRVVSAAQRHAGTTNADDAAVVVLHVRPVG